MSLLGLSGEPPRDENIFKRLFWPANQPYAADTLGQQGLWVCIAVAILSAAVSAATGHPLIGLLVLAFYWMGGMGVREHSVAAAVLVALGYLGSIGMLLLVGRPPGILDILIGGLLLANVRGTYIASRWKRPDGPPGQADPEVFPQRLNTSFSDRLIDQWPARFWPKGRYVFFAVAAVYGVLFVLGAVGTLHGRAELRADPTDVKLQDGLESR